MNREKGPRTKGVLPRGGYPGVVRAEVLNTLGMNMLRKNRMEKQRVWIRIPRREGKRRGLKQILFKVQVNDCIFLGQGL